MAIIAANAAATPAITPLATIALLFTFLLFDKIATHADKSVNRTARHAVISIAVSGLPQLESIAIIAANAAATPVITPIAAIDLVDTEPILPMILMHTAKSVSNRIMHAVDTNADAVSIVESKYTHPANTAIVTAKAIIVPLFLLMCLAFARTIANPIIMASNAATPLASLSPGTSPSNTATPAKIATQTPIASIVVAPLPTSLELFIRIDMKRVRKPTAIIPLAICSGSIMPISIQTPANMPMATDIASKVPPHFLSLPNILTASIMAINIVTIQPITVIPFATAFSSIVPAILTATAMANNATEIANMVGPIVLFLPPKTRTQTMRSAIRIVMDAITAIPVTASLTSMDPAILQASAISIRHNPIEPNTVAAAATSLLVISLVQSIRPAANNENVVTAINPFLKLSSFIPPQILIATVIAIIKEDIDLNILAAVIALRVSINLVQAIKPIANAVNALTAVIPCLNFSGLSKELKSITVTNLPSNIDNVIITGNAFNGCIPLSLLNTKAIMIIKADMTARVVTPRCNAFSSIVDNTHNAPAIIINPVAKLLNATP